MRAALATIWTMALVACAPSWKSLPHDRPIQRVPAPVLHEKPRQNAAGSDWWDRANLSTVVPLSHLVSPARYLDRLTRGRPALDVNAFGEVPDSSWYQNREISTANMRTAVDRDGGPAPGKLVVISGKLEGATPGIVVRDQNGVLWFLKFDPPAFRQMTTSAEVVVSHLLHAAGYYVPEMYSLDLDLARLEVSPDAKTRDDYNRKVRLEREALDGLLLNLNPDSKGRLLAIFSKAVEGEPLGPFSYRGVRADDPNDRIPHERRRSLRGLWLFAAWVNNTDTRRQNTLDTFVVAEPETGLGTVRHYLLDFGDSFGSGGNREKYIGEGYEKTVDWPEMGKRLIALGLKYPYWLRIRRSPYRSVGPFEAEVFDPEHWNPSYGNPAFQQATLGDTFWAASVLARFKRPIVAAAVEAGRYSEAGAAEYVVETLMKRRAKLLRFAFSMMLPIARPEVVSRYTVRFDDLEVEAGLASPSEYHWSVRWNRDGRPDRSLGRGTSLGPTANLRGAVETIMRDDPAAFRRDPFLTLVLRQKTGPEVELHLRVVRDHLLPVGIQRGIMWRSCGSEKSRIGPAGIIPLGFSEVCEPK